MIVDKYELEELVERFGYDYIEHDIDNFYEWLDNNDEYQDWLRDREENEDLGSIDRAYREWRDKNEL